MGREERLREEAEEELDALAADLNRMRREPDRLEVVEERHSMYGRGVRLEKERVEDKILLSRLSARLLPVVLKDLPAGVRSILRQEWEALQDRVERLRLTTVKRQTGYSEETCWWETVEGESGPEVEVLTDADVKSLERAIDDLGEKLRRKRG